MSGKAKNYQMTKKYILKIIFMSFPFSLCLDTRTSHPYMEDHRTLQRIATKTYYHVSTRKIIVPLATYMHSGLFYKY